jgi:hypothetical protein
MRLNSLTIVLVFLTFCSPCMAQTDERKECISESSPSIAPFVPTAKKRLFDEVTFASEYCLSKFEMTFDETRLSFAREVEFDAGSGTDDIQHGLILFYVVFDSRTSKVLRTRQVLRP